MALFNSFLSFITVSVVLNGAFAAIGPAADLVITNGNVSPDGFTREAILAGTSAGASAIGTLITANKGDNFNLNVVNNLNVPDQSILQSTSIHWHGFFQKGTGWADGPAFVNQCPITKGHSFAYQFSTTDQAGTFWYHSHLSTQYCDGLRGPIVVYDPNDPHKALYDVDDESTVITLADWYHAKAKSLRFPTPDSTLINGLGRWAQGDPANPSALAVITVEKGKKYRMRLVNVACDPAFTFQIDNHTMNIIEVDSVNHVAHEVDSLRIFAGQRYSFVLNANQDKGNYWIRANPNLGTNGFANGINSAILRYVGAPEEEPPVQNIATSNLLNEADLVPLENPGAPGQPVKGGVDYALNLNFQFTSAAVFTVNGATYTSPTVPVLLQLLSGAQTADTLMPAGSVFALPPNATVELSMPGGLLGLEHPLHLHGHAFDVVRAAGSTTYNYANPPRRDVVSIGSAADNVTIRFRTDNPGPWFLHCHIDWHLEAGFAVVFAERTAEWKTAINPTAAWNDLCPTYSNTPSTDL